MQRDLGPARFSAPRHPLFPTEEASACRRDLLAGAPEAGEALITQLVATGSGARLVIAPDRTLVITTDPAAPGVLLDKARSGRPTACPGT